MLILTLGSGFLVWCSKAVKALVDYAEFQYPLALALCLVGAIFLICLLVPALLYRGLSRETVSERLRREE